MKDDDVIRSLWEKAKALPPPTPEQVLQGKVSFVYGQMACMRKYRDATTEELFELRVLVEKVVREKESAK